MFLLLFLLIPIVAALLLLFIKSNASSNSVSIGVGILTLIGSVYLIMSNAADYDASWLPVINSRFSLHLDGLSKLLILLTSITFPSIFIATKNNEIAKRNIFLSLMMFTQAGLIGVFLACDALVFYFCWELALIPIYFLCSIWGGEKRVAVLSLIHI